jgi:plasmid stabilization system protein ParE
MGLTIRWSERARFAIEDLLAYIGAENSEAARGLWQRVNAALLGAASHPEQYRFLPELGHTYREIVSVRPFRMIYRIEGEELRVLAVLRTEQAFDPARFLDTP